ncbi:MAG TPA: ferredoxin [Pseudonocardia sp.]|nr:ferredoxin [Pseudonocardia sp.]
MSWHVELDRDICAGHGLCSAVAPDLIDIDDDGYPVIGDPVPGDQLEAARDAVTACPEQALKLLER